MADTPEQHSTLALGLAKDLGFALAGICTAKPSAFSPEHRAWIDADKHGEMQYLEQHLDLRLDPTKLEPGTRSIVCVADFYGPRSAPPQAPADTPMGKLASYGLGRDYHKTIKKRLHKLCDALQLQHPTHFFRATTDTAPLLEREHASHAGLGWQGKNTLLIHPRLGSFMLLGAVLTDLPMQSSAEAGYPSPLVAPTDHCANCTRCIDACPTDAIATHTRELDARRCISYLTLEHRSDIAPELATKMGTWIGGCDICQDVCPYNTIALRHPQAILDDYAARDDLAAGLDLQAILSWQEHDRQQALSGTAFMRMKLPVLKRNAAIALKNWQTKSCP